jgi:cytochrome c oxidase subunit 2
MTRTNLWKILSIAAILTLVVVGCGDDDDDDDPTATSPSAGGAPTETRESSDSGGGGGEGGDGELVAMGEELYNAQGCVACHSTDGSAGVGPTWQGLWMAEITLDDGTTVEANEEYITESIREPNAKIHEGFQPDLMPAFPNFTDEEVSAIIAYIESLS